MFVNKPTNPLGRELQETAISGTPPVLEKPEEFNQLLKQTIVKIEAAHNKK